MVLVVRAALAVVGSATTPTPVPIIDASLSTSTLLRVAAGAATVLVLLHSATAVLTARLSSEALQSARAQAIQSYFGAGWEAQSRDREGALQESVSSHAMQSSLLVSSFATALTALINLIVVLLASVVIQPVAMAGLVLSGIVLFSVLRPVTRATQHSADEFVGANSTFAEGISKSASLSMEYRMAGVESAAVGELIRSNSVIARIQRRARFVSLFGMLLYRDLAVLFLVAAVAVLHMTGGSDLVAVSAVVLLTIRAIAYATLLYGTSQTIREYAPNLEVLSTRAVQLDQTRESTGSEEIERLDLFSMDAVSYTYPDGHVGLRNVSLTIHAGECVGIIGPSGGGKSTLLQIMLRLRRPTTGAVLVDGTAYEEISPSSWSKLVGFVPQEPKLMEASIAENIRFLRPEISIARIQSAAEAAHIADEIRLLPNGFDTMLGPRGVGLSGGQKQRVAIARALAGQPQLLVLDEPTSALDPASEDRLRNTIRALRGSTAVAIVAHRESTLIDCDRVVTVVDGCIK